MFGLETIGFLVAGFMAGNWLRGRLTQRWINSERFKSEVQQQLEIAFRAGFMTAADIVTIEGQEELAGKLRRTAATVAAANDNH